MGKPVNTDLKIEHMGNSTFDGLVITSLVKTNPLVILDNIPGKRYFPIFDEYYFESKDVPLLISREWNLGGGGMGPDYVNFFLDPKSNLFLPTIVISGLIGNLAYDLAKKVFTLFKKKFPRKRQPVVFYSEKEEITYYEFPSQTTVDEFEEGIKEMPDVAKNNPSQSRFIRSLKTKTWEKEDNS